jgi:glutathione S-transferase
LELFVDNNAPNARRVLMFVAEKNIDLSVIEVCVDEGEHRTPEFLAMNPLGQVPVLKFPDGTCVSESMAICRYLDETHEGPRLFGDTAERRAVLEKTYDLLNAQLTESSYVAGKAFSVADIVAYCGAELALLWGVLPGPSLAAFSRWHEEVSERPAARIARYR